MTGPDPWWRRAVVYQVYIRSFADADGDGVGDIAGIRSRLAYLRDARGGRAVDHPLVPLADGRWRLRRGRLHRRRPGVRVGRRGRRARGGGARARAAGAHRPCAQPHLERPPVVRRRPGLAARVAGPRPVRVPRRPGAGRLRAANGWIGVFGGPAWKRVTEADGRRASGTSTCSRPSSRTSTGRSPRSPRMFEAMLRSWFARGVDGFRIDVANALVKDLSSGTVRATTRSRSTLGRRARRPRSRTRTACTRSTARGGRSPTRRTRPGFCRARSTRRPSSDSRATSAPTSSTARSTSRSCGAGWDAARLRRSSTTRSRHSARSGQPRPGCCPTTTRPVT